MVTTPKQRMKVEAGLVQAIRWGCRGQIKSGHLATATAKHWDGRRITTGDARLLERGGHKSV